MGKETNILPAPFGRRLLAFVIDVFLFYFVVYSISVSVFTYKMGLKNIDFSLMSNEGIVIALEFIFYSNFVLFFMYMSFFELSFGQTFGKKIMRIRVSGINSFGKAFLRNLAVLVPFVGWIDLFPLISSEQRFSERISNTQVLYEPINSSLTGAIK